MELEERGAGVQVSVSGLAKKVGWTQDRAIAALEECHCASAIKNIAPLYRDNPHRMESVHLFINENGTH